MGGVRIDILDRIHHVELNNLKKIIQICDQLNVNYFLIGGSLLGAIRHKGFIPWDDDMDIGMLRNDYEQFAQYAPSLLKNDHYFLQTAYSDKNYGFSYMKLLDRHTYIEEKNNVNRARKGVFIDIFPFDRIPEDPGDQRSQLARFKLLDSRIIVKAGYRWIETPLYRHSDLDLDDLQDLETMKHDRETIMRQYNQQSLTHIKNIASQYAYDKEIMTTNEALNLISVPFEKITVRVPKNYDAILTRLYGNYHQLPPVRQRTEKHISKLIMDNQLFT
ncbi:LicD family protein [Secundilactobacillus collinoides]|uniref:LicD family protein n=1 Tax=Secundilactobacillus collinoides TaxID=33960 RepID=UPI000A63FD4D|nr:LicD family protein [Secundilactobacillus collinoides]